NSAVGQALLAKRMGKRRIVAETGAGQHGVATAAACALLGLECIVYMGTVDARRQQANVFRMKLLGAEVREVGAGSRTLKDAVNEAIRDWVTNVRTTYYLLGSAIGPHPYPAMVRDFQSIIGTEARDQSVAALGRLPDAVVACVGGGSNAIGIFSAFLADKGVRLIGVEAGGEGIASGRHAASIVGGAVGVLHGSRTLVLQDDQGQIRETHSVSAGLDYPGVGPEHAELARTGRVRYIARTDREALDAFALLSRSEGIIPALEPAPAIAALRQGIGLGDCIAEAATVVHERDVPVLLMGYANPFLRYRRGLAGFAADASRAGVAGIIVPDLPAEESAEFDAALEPEGIARIDLYAPTTPDDRLARLVPRARGFGYCVSITGVTGA